MPRFGDSKYIIVQSLLLLALAGGSPPLDARAYEPVRDSRTEVNRLNRSTPIPHEAR
jgi:hypothetical protein